MATGALHLEVLRDNVRGAQQHSAGRNWSHQLFSHFRALGVPMLLKAAQCQMGSGSGQSANLPPDLPQLGGQVMFISWMAFVAGLGFRAVL